MRGNEGPGKDVEAILALLNDGRDYEGEEERKENENRCPHCNKPLQIHDAVLVKTSRSVHVDYHRTHIGPGWRERSTYKNYEIEYYRCQECDRIIKEVGQIESAAGSKSFKIALIVSLSSFVLSVVVSLMKTNPLTWLDALMSFGFWLFIYLIVFIVLAVSLERLFSRRATEIIKETGITLHPYFPGLQERAKGEPQVTAIEKAMKKRESKYNKRIARTEKEISKNYEGWHLPNSGESVQCNERGQNTVGPDSSPSQNTEQEKDKDVWTLLDFAKMKGKMQVGTFVNKETGDSFKSCIFTDNKGNRTYVEYSPQLGALAPAEIAAQKEILVVKKLMNGHYVLGRRAYRPPTISNSETD